MELKSSAQAVKHSAASCGATCSAGVALATQVESLRNPAKPGTPSCPAIAPLERRRIRPVAAYSAVAKPLAAKAESHRAFWRRRVKQDDPRLKWWREAKFGMFIHWGLYAVLAGVWKGKEMPGIGEWIKQYFQIPASEYEQLARQFNPVKFNAEEWVRIVKNAGMKYIVITSKHHEGFAMYHSKASSYNIVDATPFKRDPMKELSEACHKEGIKLCFYYSHALDWNHPEAARDSPEDDKKDFARYLEEKAMPQVREILTQYGPIGLVWFDVPKVISEEQSERFVNLVREIQPDCLVNSRVGHGKGDYESAGDNHNPTCVREVPWESPATLNDTWGYKKNDHNWKSAKMLIRVLVDIVSKGGNNLLNVGPTAEGIIPQPSVERLAAMGDWLKVNGEAIYGTKAGPFPYELEWGAITAKPQKIFLHVFQWPEEKLVIYGFKNNVRKAYLLADRERKQLRVDQAYHKDKDYYELRIHVPASAPDENVSVIVLEIEGEPEVDTSLMQRPDGKVVLESFQAQIHPAQPGSMIGISFNGIIEKWVNPEDWLSWDFKMIEPGNYGMEIWTYAIEKNWDEGHELAISVAGKDYPCFVEAHEWRVNPRSPRFYHAITRCGQVTLSEPGSYTLSLKPKNLRSEKGFGFTLRSVIFDVTSLF